MDNERTAGLGTTEFPTYEKIPEIPDISDEEEKNLQVNHMLLLNMGTLPFARPGEVLTLEENTYSYQTKDNLIHGFGQLEPVPNLLIKEEKTPELLLILASEATKKELDFIVKRGEREERKHGSALSFFKEQISKSSNGVTRFKTIDLEKSVPDENGSTVLEKDIVTAIGNVVRIIREQKQKNPKVKLYLDIHGGPREDQIILDAVINLLASEKIYIEDAFSIARKNAPIMNVTRHMQIFRFVSAMSEFTNFGQGRSISRYVESATAGKEKSEDHQMISKGINDISDALLLCKVEEFEKALDQMQAAILRHNQEEEISDYLDIFIQNIQNDYGSLLKKEERNLVREVQWALKKGFYQQCLAIIESKTPQYVMPRFFETKPEDGKINCSIWSKLHGNRIAELNVEEFLRNVLSSGKNVYSRKIEQEYLSKAILYSDNWSMKEEKQGCVISIRDYSAENRRSFDLEFVSRLGMGQEKAFRNFIKTWKLMKEIRNIVMHSNNRQVSVNGKKRPVNVALVQEQAKRFLDQLRTLEDGLGNLQ